MNKTYIEYGGKTIPFYVHENLLTRYGRLPDYISNSIETTHIFFEIKLLEYWKTKFGTIDSFIDVGANIGNHSIYAREVLGASDITCFEPFPINADILEKNVAIAKVYRVGLSDTAGEMSCEQNIMEFKGQPGVYCANAGNTTLIPGKGIPVRTLDSYNIQKCDLLKIDAEGMESAILSGAKKTLMRVRPYIYAEANLMVHFMDMVEILAPLGYYMTKVLSGGNFMIEFTPKERL